MTANTSPIAVVTGATGGMGTDIVRDLARTHRVIAIGRNEQALAALSAIPSVETRQIDLQKTARFAEIGAGIDRIDVLVHAAAIGDHVSVENATEEVWLDALTTNVVAPALLTRALLPQLRAAEGTVVFIGSGAGTKPVPGSAVYTASKHALRALADVLRIDEEQHRIRVVTLAPGQTDTPMLRRGASGNHYTPERYIQPSTVAETVRTIVELPADAHITDIALRPRQEIARL
ncbi:SDR family oxidoreductase [Microbacterium amylolyticum]|uniref:NADP-dependent 3-hydroxy acid dehydrogenase YdfG n=1 Tax=Microbacterium amylolyticum TaxID=936337 RepID=A0ABS4ZGV8_9MICO|nr:SDR family oxidoreductase [Microbacterium amylolyticum]MBP2436524.1 NADP-dependent 3-hydroxy acid dehydrogenase YdfG [Microbacterium amylolyticum]